MRISSWEIFDKKQDGNTHRYKCNGWGKLEMRWHLPSPYTKVTATVQTPPIQKELSSVDEVLFIELDLPYGKEASITLEVQ